MERGQEKGRGDNRSEEVIEYDNEKRRHFKRTKEDEDMCDRILKKQGKEKR